MEIKELDRTLIESHIETCVALQSFLVREGDAISAEQFLETAEDTHSALFGIVDDGKLVGMGVVSKIVHPVRTNAFINNIVIDPEHRGKGYFTLLMDALEAKAAEWGCARIELTCSRSEVQPLYEKRGFVKKETAYFIKPV